MRTMYAVSTGCYSDYTVRCLCDDRATAERLCGSFEDRDDARVEEFLVIEKPEEAVPVKTWRSETVDGEPAKWHPMVEEDVRPWEISRPEVFRVKHPYGTIYPDGAVVARVTSTRGPEQALKTCRDLTKQFIALEPTVTTVYGRLPDGVMTLTEEP